MAAILFASFAPWYDKVLQCGMEHGLDGFSRIRNPCESVLSVRSAFYHNFFIVIYELKFLDDSAVIKIKHRKARQERKADIK